MLVSAWARTRANALINHTRSLHTCSTLAAFVAHPPSRLLPRRAPTLHALDGLHNRASPWTQARSFASLLRTTPAPAPSAPPEPRFFSANSAPGAAPPAPLPTLSPPAVAHWLLLSAALVFGTIAVGGVTRLTESGLSVTEWRPLTGVLPPRSATEWDAALAKYRATPEGILLNPAITLAEFQRIYHMEWAHRIAARLVGLAFALPLAYFAARRQLAAGLPARLAALALLIGAQGALGWHMVQSGLAPALLAAPGATPRVSQYRLAAHLGAALALYAALLGTALAVRRDWAFARRGAWSGLRGAAWAPVLRSPLVRRFRAGVWAATALVFVTALSGAFVAGLDAGLVYNEFPTMGGRLAPPRAELMDPAYATQPDGSDLWWRNLLENPTTVQFDHRILALATYTSTGLLFASTRARALRAALPALTTRLAAAAFVLANAQALLGITTLLYLVPVPLATAHQAGSVALLSGMVALAVSLRAPGAAARVWRQARAAAATAAPKM